MCQLIFQDLQLAASKASMQLRVSFTKRTEDTRKLDHMATFDMWRMIRTIIALHQQQQKQTTGPGGCGSRVDQSSEDQAKGKKIDWSDVVGLAANPACTDTNQHCEPEDTASDGGRCKLPDPNSVLLSESSYRIDSAPKPTAEVDMLPSKDASAFPPVTAMERQIYLVKPTLEDRYYQIELSWMVESPKLRPSAITQHISRH
ncbi:MAG: hypothetical protein Q9163_003322 [Psora crenata]